MLVIAFSVPLLGSVGAAAPTETRDEPASTGKGAEASASWFWLSGKAMPTLGLSGDLVRRLSLDAEVSFLWSTAPTSDPRDGFLGNRFGLFGTFEVYGTRRFDARVGLGADLYYLWGIHDELLEAAFAGSVDVTGWFTEHLGLFAGLRGYGLSTNGLDLGTFRDGTGAAPVVAQTGLRWRGL